MYNNDVENLINMIYNQQEYAEMKIVEKKSNNEILSSCFLINKKGVDKNENV
jgi:hypothetical protein